MIASCASLRPTNHAETSPERVEAHARGTGGLKSTQGRRSGSERERRLPPIQVNPVRAANGWLGGGPSGRTFGRHYRPTLKVATRVLGDAVEVRLAQAAPLAGGEDDPTILTVLGAAQTIVSNQRVAARLLEKALAFDPNSAWARHRSGWLQSYLEPLCRYRALAGKGPTRPARRSLGISHRCLAGRTKREPIFRDCATSTRT